MDPAEHWLLLGALGIAAGFCWFACFRSLVKSRIIEDTPTSRIRSAHQGYVELVGFSKQDAGLAPLFSPLTHSPCLWYRYSIERYERRGRNTRWRRVEHGRSDAPFALEDGTGKCYIHPARAEISVNHRQVWHGNTRRPLGKTSSGLFGSRYRYTEELLQDGQMLYCLGRFQTIHPPTLREQTQQRMGELLNQWKLDYDKLLARFDRDGNGQLDAGEWEHARRTAELEAYRELRDKHDTDPVNILSYSPVRRQPFLIATSDPMKLIKRYQWQFIGYGIVAVAATVGSLALGVARIV